MVSVISVFHSNSCYDDLIPSPQYQAVKSNLFQEEAAVYRHLAAVLRHSLLMSCDGEETQEELQGSDCCFIPLNKSTQQMFQAVQGGE